MNKANKNYSTTKITATSAALGSSLFLLVHGNTIWVASCLSSRWYLGLDRHSYHSHFFVLRFDVGHDDMMMMYNVWGKKFLVSLRADNYCQSSQSVLFRTVNAVIKGPSLP